MPQGLPALLFFVAIAAAVGVLAGWHLRGRRVRREKEAIHASWREQMEAQKLEHDRIADQNRGLMEKISEHRASQDRADSRANELSESLQEAFRARDEAQQELRRLQSNLEVAIRQRDQLKREAEDGVARSRDKALRDKDEKIFRLSRELESWRNRLPPLLDRYRERDLEAQQLEVELEKASARIAEFERHRGNSDETTIEPVDDASLANALDASNEQFDDDPAPASGDGTGGNSIADYLHRSHVDFEIGGASDETNEDACLDESLAEVFEDLSGGARVDEWLDASNASTTRSESGRADDLQQIKGVGPAIEKVLNRLGIYRYRQIADMSEVDIDRVAQELRGFRTRIYREDWMGQARLLELEKADSTS